MANLVLPAIDEIKVGDRLRITTKSGEVHEVDVRSVTKDEIVGDDKTFTMDEIAKVKIGVPSPIKTGVLVLYIVSAIIGILELPDAFSK